MSGIKCYYCGTVRTQEEVIKEGLDCPYCGCNTMSTEIKFQRNWKELSHLALSLNKPETGRCQVSKYQNPLRSYKQRRVRG